MASVRIGISGWSYKDWEDSFYPDDLPREDELGYAAERFDTLEINGTDDYWSERDECVDITCWCDGDFCLGTKLGMTDRLHTSSQVSAVSAW